MTSKPPGHFRKSYRHPESEPAPEKLTIRPEYRGLTGIERYCREEYSRSGPASVWRVYAYLWANQGQVYGSEKTIQRGTGLSASAVNNAIHALWERGVLEFNG